MSANQLNSLGIQDLAKCIDNGTATLQQVFDIVEARIHKRVIENRPLLKPVVEYRNSLAASITASGLAQIPLRDVPSYTKAQPNAALPTDPEQLADVVFATVGAANVGAVISRLTARIVGQ